MTSLPPIENILVRQSSPIREALLAIDANAQGIVFVVDDTSRLVGVLTDGDIRRALLRGTSLDEQVHAAMQRQFTSRPVGTSSPELLSLLSDSIRHIPLVNESNVPVDYACKHRLHRIPIMEPSLSGNELDYVTECIKTTWISSQGAFVRKFEAVFGEYCGVPNALAVSNGTVALHLGLAALGIGPGDEVIVPDLTFAASINAVVYTGATPVIVDVDHATWTLDPVQLKANVTARTKAIMPVHLYGHPCHMQEIMAIARQHGLLVIEDCAEAIGSTYKGQMVGSFGDVAAFSFFGNKTITTGEGGMVLCRDAAVHDRAKRLRDHGMSPGKRYWHDEVGYNYRMTNIQGAIGVAQMERVQDFVSIKQDLAAGYDACLRNYAGITLPPREDWGSNTFWLYTIVVEPGHGVTRDDLMAKLLLNGVETRPVFYPLHEMPPYTKYAHGEYPVATHLSRNGMSLPSSVTLTKEMQDGVVRALHTLLATRDLVSGS
jgi:perosamine synthetase